MSVYPVAFDEAGFSTAQEKSSGQNECYSAFTRGWAVRPFLALVLQSHQYIHTLEGAADPFLSLQPTCGGKVPY